MFYHIILILFNNIHFSPSHVVWPILARWFRDLRLNCTDFRALRCVGCGLDHFLCSGFGSVTQNSYFFGFSKSYSEYN